MNAGLTLRTNLIRDLVPDAPARRRMYTAMCLYLFLGGLAVVAVVGYATRQCIQAKWDFDEAHRLRAQAMAGHDDNVDLPTYTRRLRSGIEEDAARIDKLSALLARRTSLARLVIGLQQGLPDGACISRLQLNAEEGRAHFSVTMDVDKEDARSPAQELISAWSANSMVNQELADLRAHMTERSRADGKAVIVQQFSAQIKRQAGEHGPGNL